MLPETQQLGEAAERDIPGQFHRSIDEKSLALFLVQCRANVMNHHVVITPMPIQVGHHHPTSTIPFKSRGFQNFNNAYVDTITINEFHP